MAANAIAATTYPREPTAAEVEYLVSEVKDWSIGNGLTVRPPPALVATGADPLTVLATSAPVTLFPSPFPQTCFNQAQVIQRAYNELYASIAQDEPFLKGIVEEILEVDTFIADLWEVHLKVKAEGYAQTLALGLFRSDYMVHQDAEDSTIGPVVKQVEFNTIASSFGGLSAQTSRLHKYLARNGFAGLLQGSYNVESRLPENTSTQSLAAGLRAAHIAYVSQGFSHPPCVLFIVQDGERNIFDQRHLEYALAENGPQIPVFRLPFSQVLQQTAIGSFPKRELLYYPPHSPSQPYEVSVVYYRSGYGPGDYPNKSSWSARLQIERSRAIKCPTILTQLAGCKKVQQVLATPNADSANASILSRFMDRSPAVMTGLEKTFTNIYPMDESPAGLEARKLALDPVSCLKYVLKPQREGGGNNTYKAAIPKFLKSIPESHWKGYILMEIINPPPIQNMILRNGNVEVGGVICELGVYGTVLWDARDGEVIYNENAGYLLRTKGDQSEEGGVAAGFGAMDSVMLV